MQLTPNPLEANPLVSLDLVPQAVVGASASVGSTKPEAPPATRLPGHPSADTLARMRRYLATYTRKTGTETHPDPEVTEAVMLGLGHHAETLGRPLCPCRFYRDAAAEVKDSAWICPCDDMRRHKYCHCLLFTNAEGLPITEHLPPDHPGRKTYGLVKDPHPELRLHHQAPPP